MFILYNCFFQFWKWFDHYKQQQLNIWTISVLVGCSAALGMEKGHILGIKDTQISASSVLSIQAKPSQARLNDNRG